MFLIPYGYCHCGCGKKTNICKHTKDGIKRGQPTRFLIGHGRCIYPPEEQRFWAKVYKKLPEECWLWTGAKNHRKLGGHGSMLWKGKLTNAHRISWEIHYGPIPKGMQVLHDCPSEDNPACVNPRHLYLGTHADNMRDKAIKGQAKTKLRPEEAIIIFNLKGKMSAIEIGKTFNVHSMMAYHIWNKKVWKHTIEQHLAQRLSENTILPAS